MNPITACITGDSENVLWKTYARANERLNAIRVLRHVTGSTLRDAKEVVDDYLYLLHGGTKFGGTSPNSCPPTFSRDFTNFMMALGYVNDNTAWVNDAIGHSIPLGMVNNQTPAIVVTRVMAYERVRTLNEITTIAKNIGVDLII